MAWQDLAACRGTEVDYFSARPDAVAAAVALCRSCPVRVDCLVEDLGTPGAWRFGVRAGLVPDERIALLGDAARSSAVEVARTVLAS